MPGRASQTREESPESGIYSITHQNHQLPNVVILLKGETFPPCTECLPPVSFESVRATPYFSGRTAINSRYSNVLDSKANWMNAVSLHTWKSAQTKMCRANSAEEQAPENSSQSFVWRKALMEV